MGVRFARNIHETQAARKTDETRRVGDAEMWGKEKSRYAGRSFLAASQRLIGLRVVTLLALEALHAITFAAREIRSLQRLKVKLRREALATRLEV